ncbi:MAG: hypothetical protein ABI923_06615 [bacterium]
MAQQPETLEERVAYVEENIRVLNKATTDTATAIKALLSAHQASSNNLSEVLSAVLDNTCPFPPECVAPDA